MRCRRLEMLPVECIARGYLTGSGLKEYEKTGAVSGVALPPGLVEGSRLPEPIFTPSTKAPLGEHDEAMTFGEVEDLVGARHRGPAARADPGRLRPRRRDGGGERDHRRRHQAGVRPRPGDGRDRAGRRGAHARLVAVLAGRPLGSRAGRRPRSTSSSCATGRRPWTGTGPRRGRRCRRRWSTPPAPATSRPTNASPACPGSPDQPVTGMFGSPSSSCGARRLLRQAPTRRGCSCSVDPSTGPCGRLTHAVPAVAHRRGPSHPAQQVRRSDRVCDGTAGV